MADKEEIFKDGAINLHHHDVSSSILVKEFFALHLAGLDNHDDLLLDLVQGGCFRRELNCVNTEGDHKEEGLVVVRPVLLQRVPKERAPSALDQNVSYETKGASADPRA